MNEFKEVSETLKTKLSESTLGKQLSGIKIFDLGDEMDRPLQEAPQEDAEVESPENNRSEADTPESDAQTDNAEKKARELTEEERQELKDKLGWSDEKLNKCTLMRMELFTTKLTGAIWKVKHRKMVFHI